MANKIHSVLVRREQLPHGSTSLEMAAHIVSKERWQTLQGVINGQETIYFVVRDDMGFQLDLENVTLVFQPGDVLYFATRKGNMLTTDQVREIVRMKPIILEKSHDVTC